MKTFAALFLLVALPLSAASRLPARAKHGMVASVDPIASKVGVDVMKRGGNAMRESQLSDKSLDLLRCQVISKFAGIVELTPEIVEGAVDHIAFRF